ncbi:MAG: hypothetical protein L6M37_04510 [Candidatus Methylarchaceae archaeon HK02M1]|nr:hypothetical protein [Candidatus Methylarchaceae archaeon HK02M1]
MEFTRSLSLLKAVKALPNGAGVIALGVGTAGCCILAHLHHSGIPIEKFVYISSDEEDLCYSPLGEKLLIASDSNLSRLPSAVRGVALDYIDQIREILSCSKYVFIISGVGGSVGSGLTPFLVKVAKEMETTVVSILAMPFKFEKHKHFHAGVALRQIRKLSDAVIVIDNDSLREMAPKKSILDVFTLINDKISTALNKLIVPPKGREIGIGLKKFAENIKEEGYAVLSVCESFATTGDVIAGAVRSVCQIAEPDQARKAMLYLISDGKISTEEVATSVERLRSFFGKGSIEVQYGISDMSGQGLTAILLASGFRGTKFDGYDPIANVLQDIEMDDDLDTSINVDFQNMYNLNG